MNSGAATPFHERQPACPAVRFASLAAALLLVSCGGGGGGGGGDGDVAAPVPADTTPVVASTCGLGDFAATALARMNQLRAAGADCRTRGRFSPAGALAWNTSLTLAAERHSRDMMAHNFFAHTGSDGSTLSVRAGATGDVWSSLGENIAAGYPGIDSVMAGWMASDGHCANLMNPGFTEVGLVCVSGTAATTYGNYWTLDLGRSR
jgi:uncharacterized protein YkwD